MGERGLRAVALIGIDRRPHVHTIVAPFPLADAAGRAFALPFLGGLDVPRPQFVDIDADGDLDLFVQEYSNTLAFFENTGTAARPAYTWRSDKYQNLDIGEWYRFVDIDADGRVDLVSEEPFSHVRFYRNIGSRTQPTFESAGQLLDADGQPVFFDRQNIPAFVDLDCDKRLDLFVGRVDGTVARLEAEQPGSVKFGLSKSASRASRSSRASGSACRRRCTAPTRWRSPTTTRTATPICSGAISSSRRAADREHRPDVQHAVVPGGAGPAAARGDQDQRLQRARPVDLDGDGDLDFLMGVLGGAFNPIATAADNFFYWERSAKDRFELRTKRFLDGLDLGNDTVPALVDLDADGDLDLVVGNKIDPAAGDSGRLAFFTNEGTRTAPGFRWTTSLPMADAYHLAPAFGDLDGDGDQDLLLGTWNKDVLFFRNQGTAREPAGCRTRRRASSRRASARPRLCSATSTAIATWICSSARPTAPSSSIATTARRRRRGSCSSATRSTTSSVGRRSAPALVDVDGDGASIS